jgi:hypothetical protein
MIKIMRSDHQLDDTRATPCTTHRSGAEQANLRSLCKIDKAYICEHNVGHICTASNNRVPVGDKALVAVSGCYTPPQALLSSEVMFTTAASQNTARKREAEPGERMIDGYICFRDSCCCAHHRTRQSMRATGTPDHGLTKMTAGR